MAEGTLCQFLGLDLKRLAASNHSWNDFLGRTQLPRRKSNHCETAMLQGSSGSYGEVSFRVRCQGWGSRERERESTARHIKAADMSEDAIFEGKLQPQLSQLTPHGSELSSLAKLFVNSWPAKSQTKQSVALCLSVEGNFCCAKDNQNTYTRWTSNYTPICPDKILMPAHPRT